MKTPTFGKRLGLATFFCAGLSVTAFSFAKPPPPAFAGTQFEQLWSRLDLDAAGMGDVKAAVEAHDDAKAMAALNARFKARMSVTPRAPGTASASGSANNALEFRFRRHATDPLYTLHKDFDWVKGPPGEDHHWLALFSSLGIISELAGDYAKTGNPKYAVGAMSLFNDWADHCPPGTKGAPSWSLATTMIRVGNFINAFPHLLSWPDWPAEQEARFLNSIAEQADIMNSKRGPGNQDATNSEQLMHAGNFFPEFKNAPQWIHTGNDRLASKIFEDTLPDGSQVELCSGYDKGAVATYTRAVKTLKDAGQTLAPGYQERLQKMYDWLLKMMRPDGDLPTNGDSAGSSVRDFLKHGGEMFNRPDMTYAGTSGKSGTAPAFTDASLPDAGYYILRSGWGAKDLYLFMDIARQEPLVSHQYNDALHIFLFAYGRDFFPASGTFTYGGEASAKAHATPSQNTVAVDNSDQAGVASVTHAFFSSNALSFLDGSQDGYPGVTHRRQVLFVRPDPGVPEALPYFLIIDRITGKGAHRTDQYFHLPPEANPAVDSQKARFQTAFATGANVIVENLVKNGVTTETFTDDMSPSQGLTVKRPVVTFRQNGSLPLTYVTLVFPYPGAAPTYAARLLPHNPAPGLASVPDLTSVEVTQGDITDTLTVAPGSFSTSQTQGNVSAGLLREVKGASQTTWVPEQQPVTGKFTVPKSSLHDNASPSDSPVN